MTLEILTSPDLEPVRHGFFTRRGGVSSGIFQGLNCGQGSSDLAEAVDVNRARVAESMNVPRENLVTVHQVHSSNVVTVEGAVQSDSRPQADAIVTSTKGLAIAILTADCQPVLFHDQHAGVIAAAHAGWKGALNGVLEATLDAMEAIGAIRANVSATIGPCISQAAYEVGPEFLDAFQDEDPESLRYFANGHGDRLQFDLPGYGLKRLRSAGVGNATWINHCTYTDSERFYSYRRSTHENEADYGRLISAISL